jgi:hypothetical protein
MTNKKTNCKINSELERAILKEKAKGTPDIKTGIKYGVNSFLFMEEFLLNNFSSLTRKKFAV